MMREHSQTARTAESTADFAAMAKGGSARPLHGVTLRTLGGSAALDTATEHLRLLGCAIEPADAAPPADAAAGWLGTSGTGGAAALSGAECAIDWAGPVDAPLSDEVTVQAACAIMHVHGRKTGAPQPLYVDYASITAGMLAAQAVLAGALARWRGAPPRRATTSVAQAALLAVSPYLAAATAKDDSPEPLARGGAPLNAPPFESADGVRFELETFAPEAWQRFWSSLGVGRDTIAEGWLPFQRRFATATCPLAPEFARAAAGLAYAELTALADRAGASIVAVREAAPEGGPNGTPWRIAMNRAVPSAPPLAAAPDAVAPLAGLVVVESTNRVQGPLAGHLLRMLGADVVRIEPPGGDPMRGVPPIAGDCSARFLALNRGKRVVEIDIKSESGQRAVRELAGGADVFLHNWAPGRAERLGLDFGRLAARRPGLVYAHTSGWADALGPRPPMGTDFLVQAHSGLASLVRPAGEPAAPSLMTLTDVLGGVLGAEAVLAALLLRARTGLGCEVATSLFDAARVLCGATPHGWSGRPRGAGVSGVAAGTDLQALAGDPRFAAALEHEEAVFPCAPWTFTGASREEETHS